MAACRVPLVVVLGATGAGKSKLAIEIAKFFSGEIISADSMQIYKGLDIITNKVTEEEQSECPHHLISYLEADHKHYNIVDFRDAAVPIIDDLLKCRKLPVLVGGTNYYIESVLWNFLVDKKDSTLTLYDNPGLMRRFGDDQNTEDSHRETSSQSSEGISVETPARLEQTNVSEVPTQDQSPAMKRAKLTTNSISETTGFSAGSADSAEANLPWNFTSSESELSVSSSDVASASSPDFTGPRLKTPTGHNNLTDTPTSSHKSLSQREGIGQRSDLRGLSLAPQLQSFSQSLSDSAATQRSGAKHRQSQQPSELCLGGQSDTDATTVSQRVSSVLASGDPERHHNVAPASVSMSDSVCSESGCELSTLSKRKVLPCNSVTNSEGGGDLAVNSNRGGLLSKPVETFGLHTGKLKDTGLPTNVSNEVGLSLMDVDIHGGVHKDYDTYDGISSVDYDETGLHSLDNDKDGVSLDLEDFRDDPQGLVRCLHGMSPEDLYSRLQQVDPVTASRQHPNNRRKIVRALQVFYQTGRTLSSILQEQHGGRGDVKSGPLRYPKPCILWVKCRQPDLDRRLDSRVDDMMKRGLVTELENFHKEAQRLEAEKNQGSSESTGHVYPHGILQIIGFKEFHDYLQLTPEQRVTDEGQRLFEKGVADLKQATRRYAKQQVRWITNRFCSRPGPNVPPVYSVDSTDLTQWDKAVEEAIHVVQAFMEGKEPSKATEPSVQKVDSQLVRNICDVCGGRVFLHLHEWTGHLKSKKHKYNVKMAKEREKLSVLLSRREKNLKQQAQDRTLLTHNTQPTDETPPGACGDMGEHVEQSNVSSLLPLSSSPPPSSSASSSPSPLQSSSTLSAS